MLGPLVLFPTAAAATAASGDEPQCADPSSPPPPPPLPPLAARPLQLSPQLCVCVLSYKRLDLLNATLRSIVAHLEEVETDVSYEIVWVDNGSDQAERQALHRELRVEKALLLGTNYGMAFGFNTLFFRLCSAPFILTLEEDWEWQQASSSALGRTTLRDAMSVLRHDTALSGVFLRPDTLDQFLTHSPWRRAGATGIEYATYCMDRAASYLWGPYSNGPGIYARERLQAVGRQYGEPADGFPDAYSEGNYCYRVGRAGLCSAILRVAPGCDGVDQCNRHLFRHLGDERSHHSSTGRKPDIRWLVSGSGSDVDADVVRLREMGLEATPFWLQLLRVPHTIDDAVGDATISLLVDVDGLALRGGGEAHAPATLRTMVRAALDSAYAPRLVELVWLVPTAHAPLAAACSEEAARLEAAAAARGGGVGALRCVHVEAAPPSLAQRMATLAAQARGDLLLLCPRAILGFREEEPQPRPPDGGGGGGGGEGEGDAPKHHEALPGAWDRQMRAAFSGSGDVRRHAKDRLLLVQAAPRDAGRPSAHLLVHRVALELLGYAAPPVGDSWLLASLWLQQIFAGLGRYRALTRLRIEEASGPPLQTPAAADTGTATASAAAASAATAAAAAAAAPHAALRDRYELSVAQRAIDAFRLQQGMRILLPKPRASFHDATSAYSAFAAAYNQGRLAEGWPMLAQLHWSLLAVQQSEDWQLRDHIDPTMLNAVLDLQRRTLDAFSQVDAPTE